MKLYVWDNVLRDYTDGIIFAFAPNVAAARKVVLEYDPGPGVVEAIKARPRVYTGIVARVVHGGA